MKENAHFCSWYSSYRGGQCHRAMTSHFSTPFWPFFFIFVPFCVFQSCERQRGQSNICHVKYRCFPWHIFLSKCNCNNNLMGWVLKRYLLTKANGNCWAPVLGPWIKLPLYNASLVQSQGQKTEEKKKCFFSFSTAHISVTWSNSRRETEEKWERNGNGR